MKNNYKFFKLPGEVYANNIPLEQPITLDQAKSWLRGSLLVKKLPNGVEFW